MNKIKLKILLTCLCSVVLILCALLVVVNVAIPKDLERRAKKAIEYEHGEYDPEDDNKGINFLSSSVGYLEMGQDDADYIYLTEIEKAVLSFCKDKPIVDGEFYRMKDRNNNLIFATYISDESSAERYEYALYVDISAILNYVKWLNFMFGGAVILVGAIICAIGLKLGKTIESAQEIRQSFFQNASHELKTPLMAIQGYAEGIQTGVLPTNESVSVILEESDRMTVLIEELLALSKIDSAQTKSDFKETDVTEIIKIVVNSFLPAFENSQKELKVELCDEAVVLCDERQTRKAVSNLISNAFKFCKTTVYVECVNEKDKVRITISDDGEGIEKEDEPHIFDRFYTGKKGNTGIGLALTKEIIKIHGGNIRAYNRNGAVFEITLPTGRKIK